MVIHVIALDFLIVIIALHVCVISFKLYSCLDAGIKTRWWFALPLVLTYGLFNRIVILLIELELLPHEWLNLSASAQIIFWVGMLIFVYGLYQTVRKTVCPYD